MRFFRFLGACFFLFFVLVSGFGCFQADPDGSNGPDGGSSDGGALALTWGDPQRLATSVDAASLPQIFPLAEGGAIAFWLSRSTDPQTGAIHSQLESSRFDPGQKVWGAPELMVDSPDLPISGLRGAAAGADMVFLTYLRSQPGQPPSESFVIAYYLEGGRPYQSMPVGGLGGAPGMLSEMTISASPEGGAGIALIYQPTKGADGDVWVSAYSPSSQTWSLPDSSLRGAHVRLVQSASSTVVAVQRADTLSLEGCLFNAKGAKLSCQPSIATADFEQEFGLLPLSGGRAMLLVTLLDRASMTSKVKMHRFENGSWSDRGFVALPQDSFATAVGDWGVGSTGEAWSVLGYVDDRSGPLRLLYGRFGADDRWSVAPPLPSESPQIVRLGVGAGGQAVVAWAEATTLNVATASANRDAVIEEASATIDGSKMKAMTVAVDPAGRSFIIYTAQAGANTELWVIVKS